MILGRKFASIPLAALLICAGAFTHAQSASNEDLGIAVRMVQPTAADPSLKTMYDEPNLVIMPKHIHYKNLVVFFPGTHGQPKGYTKLLGSIAASGIRVIGLMYDDVPTSKIACSGKDDPNCTGNYRQERIDGGVADAPEQNTTAESIHDRLVHLLQYENKEHPEEGWGKYLAGDQPNWRRICISGHSQGAGMAAYIAKQHRVARAVLFSGGPDGYGYRSGNPKVSAWVLQPSKTPMKRWWAEYHTREPAAKLFPMGYAALKIPAKHILIFNHSLPPDMHIDRPVAYHVAVIHDERYLPEWKRMFGVQ